MTLLIETENRIKELEERVDKLTQWVIFLLPKCEQCRSVPTPDNLETMYYGKIYCEWCKETTQHSIKVNVLK